MKKLCDMTYGIVGMGLMGGSLAKAIRERVLGSAGAKGRVLGCDVNKASLELAQRQHIIDAAFLPDSADAMLSECDFVYVCLYTKATVDFLMQHKAAFKSGAIVTDISGVKAELFNHLDDILRPDVDFIPGHPMAGSEREGYAASSGLIFKDHNYILMPLAQNKTQNVELFKQLIAELGFTRIVTADARVHDHKIAFTSQLCHVIASALVQSAEDTQVTAFGGGSFEDLTRIALINAPLWTELFLANKTELLSHIQTFEKSLSDLRTLIEKEDASGLTAYLEQVRSKRTQMSVR